MKIPEGYESWRDFLWALIEEDQADAQEIAFGLCKWISEDDCEEFVRIYDLYRECDYE